MIIPAGDFASVERRERREDATLSRGEQSVFQALYLLKAA
jgi:hypothetical protein